MTHAEQATLAAQADRDYRLLHYLGLPELSLKEIGVLWGAAFVIIGIYILVNAR